MYNMVPASKESQSAKGSSTLTADAHRMRQMEMEGETGHLLQSSREEGKAF